MGRVRQTQVQLSDHLADDVPVNVGEASIDGVVPHGHAFVVDTKKVKHGRVYVVDLGGVLAVEWLVAPLVALAMGDTALNAAACEPVGEDVRIVVASLAGL